jgi:hypothetical protein
VRAAVLRAFQVYGPGDRETLAYFKAVARGLDADQLLELSDRYRQFHEDREKHADFVYVPERVPLFVDEGCTDLASVAEAARYADGVNIKIDKSGGIREAEFFIGALRPAPARRPDRGPEAADRERYGYTADTKELLLVRDAGEEVWVPYAGETDEELSALIAEARERPEEEAAPAAVAGPERRRLRPPLRGLVAGLGLIGALALIFWVVENRTGWNGLDASTRADAAALFSDEASRIAAKPVTIRCDESGDYVGAVQHADAADASRANALVAVKRAGSGHLGSSFSAR